jgi:hypothetical protein
VAGELILSFVPDAEQRLWRTITRTKHQLTRDRVRLQNQLESLLEDAPLKPGTCVSDLLGVSSRRMVWAIAKGQGDPTKQAVLAEETLKATPERLGDALQAAPTLSPLHRQILQLFLERLDLIENQNPDPAPADRQGLARSPAGRVALGRRSRFWSRLVAAGDRRGGTYGSHLPGRAAVGVLGGSLSWPGGIG